MRSTDPTEMASNKKGSDRKTPTTLPHAVEKKTKPDLSTLSVSKSRKEVEVITTEL